MFAKLLIIVLTLGMTGISLLVMRHQRIDAAHEMSVVHRRLVQHEAALWQFRSQLIERIRPETVRERLLEIDREWSPIPAPRSNAGQSTPPGSLAQHHEPANNPAARDAPPVLDDANRIIGRSRTQP